MNSNPNNQINLTIIQIKKSPRMLIKIKRMLVNNRSIAPIKVKVKDRKLIYEFLLQCFYDQFICLY